MVLATSCGLRAQTITEFPIPTAGALPSQITVGPDGAMWFTEGGAAKIGRISMEGIIQEFRLPSNSAVPAGITAGPDGVLWYCDPRRGVIGRITTEGAITEFLVTGGGGEPGLITSGPDGALWFTDQAGAVSGSIGRITTEGVITEFAIPVYSYPYGISTGQDGALWFSESGFTHAGIGRITTAGEFSNYPIPNYEDDLYGVATGSDGNVWFLDSGYDYSAVGKITPTGEITEYPASGVGQGITSGPDGALWFTDGANINRVTTDGLFTRYPVPTPDSNPLGIATGPDGNIWFVETSANKIGRLVPGPPPLCASDANTLCLNNNRFMVQVEWAIAQGQGIGSVVSGVSSNDSGVMWFFGPDNWELLIKVLDGCGVNSHFWVFGAAATDVQYTIQVTDTQTGEVRTYTNPLGTTSPAITDTAAFESCP
jgi:virginiamycin B lyase